MNQWTSAARRLAVFIGMLCSVGWSLLTHRLFGRVLTQPDGLWYLSLAEGHSISALPFASRQLAPAVVRLIAHMLHCGVVQAFYLEGAASLCLLLWIVYGLAARTAAPRWLLLTMIVLPLWPLLLAGLLLPDLWFAALLAVMIWCLHKEWYVAAALMLLPLMVSRESTLLVMVCLLVAAWRPLRWTGRCVALAATAAGGVVVKLMIHGPAFNREGISQVLYMAGKIPWNFSRNILGLTPWSNTYPILCPVPKWSMPIWPGSTILFGMCPGGRPAWPLGFGSPLVVPFLIGSTFSLLAMMSVWSWWRTKSNGPRSTMVRFCLLYGGVSLLLAPVLGTAINRMVAYAWPWMLIALPAMFAGTTLRQKAWVPVLLPALCLLDIVPILMGERMNGWVAICWVFVLNLAGYLTLRAGYGVEPEQGFSGQRRAS